MELVKFELLNFWWCHKKTPPFIKLMILWVYAKFNFRSGQRKTRLLSLVDDFITFKHFWILKKIPYLDITKDAQISMFTSMFGKHTYFDIFGRCIMSKNSGIFGHEFLYIKLYFTEKVRQKLKKSLSVQKFRNFWTGKLCFICVCTISVYKNNHRLDKNSVCTVAAYKHNHLISFPHPYPSRGNLLSKGISNVQMSMFSSIFGKHRYFYYW